MNIDIGIKTADRKAVAKQLKVLLADSYSLYLQTHNFHWNVEGPHFIELHTLFETHYSELAVAVDDIAERIRALGVYAPGTYSEFAKLSNITEVCELPKAKKMVEILTQGHEQIIKTCRSALKVAQEADDESSASLISDRMVVHEKTAWMLRALNS